MDLAWSSVSTVATFYVLWLLMAFTGREVIDTITLGTLTIPNQSMGSAIVSQGFDTVDGIVGWVALQN